MLSHKTRTHNIDTLKKELFDILIIGGGITGAGAAREAALRGYKTALIEKADFAAGTSTKSSKLVHGGFRYLQYGQIGLVRESVYERQRLLQLAPHLVHPRRCVVPFYKDSPVGPTVVNLGLWLYDLLAFSRNITWHEMLSPEELLTLQPDLRAEGLIKGAEYSDCVADDYRLVISTLLSAAQGGAIITNYVRADSLPEKDMHIHGVEVVDELTGDRFPVRARTIVNATGPWSDEVRTALFQKVNKTIRTTKGIHLIVRRSALPLNRIFMVFARADNRPVLSIPWKNYVILGTTDTDYTGDPDNVPTELQDVDYILDTFNYYFPLAQLSYSDIVSTYAGLRPLIYETGKKAQDVSREYDIIETPDNFFTVIGGKLTTFIRMGEQIIDHVGKRLKERYGISPYPSITDFKSIPLSGGDAENIDVFGKEWITQLCGTHTLEEDTATHLLETYGTNIRTVYKLMTEHENGFERIIPDLPYVWGELYYSIDYEMCVALDDFLIRRTHIFSLNPEHGVSVHEAIADRIADRLALSGVQKRDQIERYKHKIKLTTFYTHQTKRENSIHR